MVATMQLWRGVTRGLVMSGGDRYGGQFLVVYGIHKKMFSTHGTHNYNEDYNCKPPGHYSEGYSYKLPYYNAGYNNSSNEYSSRDKCFKNISEKHTPTKVEYNIEKLEYRILKMKYDFEKHYEEFHRILQDSVNEIRDGRKKAVLDINMKKLTNELNMVVDYTMEELTNDLIQLCEKYVAKPKAGVDEEEEEEFEEEESDKEESDEDESQNEEESDKEESDEDESDKEKSNEEESQNEEYEEEFENKEDEESEKEEEDEVSDEEEDDKEEDAPEGRRRKSLKG
ncbi:hypothetical protein FNV43_RR26247 [Rhamnella rubrinervis]|uniref:Uncharacterized protein n=1 Tax=Rhamnella rubrinervis TaxID=2594499 RepID=A0A8K0GNK8_9ROSA|nr:hypothetical protein FNV43_RR26247 [Rhamnella rubrinervis]